ncbi:glucokinase [Oxalobacter paraformigenes]|uniref:Glucokinase n=1 Tax=Oxalobacter paraformigenes TaxID=556268 RepID=C3X1B8_9BURK|nr:glucokinase [Oxalobacter paraformigenes]EEO27004.1 glucokinase [Oxalobacter paraformigenes]
MKMKQETSGMFPRLVGDVGGTNARFAIETAAGVFAAPAVYPNRDFPGLEDALRFYITQPGSVAAGALSVRQAAVAIANPVDGDRVRMTNSDWTFSIGEIKKAFGLDVFLLVNDFTALAMALPFLPEESLVRCGGEKARENRAIGLIGAGTGLGVSGLIPAGDRWIPLEAEGGHVSFSPANELEMEILVLAKKRYRHVSAERLISGMGLELLYGLLAEIEGKTLMPLKAHEITQSALQGTDRLCDRTVEVFCQMLGTVSGNLALTLGAQGGLYIGGGIVPHLKERFFDSGFRKRFEEKGRFSEYVARIPVFVIRDTFAAFTGVSALMNRYLGNRLPA